MRVDESRQNHAPAAIDLCNSLTIFLDPRIAKRVLRFANRDDLPADAKDSSIFDDAKFRKGIAAPRAGLPQAGLRGTQGDQLADIRQQQRFGVGYPPSPPIYWNHGVSVKFLAKSSWITTYSQNLDCMRLRARNNHIRNRVTGKRPCPYVVFFATCALTPNSIVRALHLYVKKFRRGTEVGNGGRFGAAETIYIKLVRTFAWSAPAEIGFYSSFAYSLFASLKIGMSGSASFQ